MTNKSNHPARNKSNHPIPGSVWQHYKGAHYQVIAVADHTESGELLVVYKGLNGDVWARPLDIWHEHVLMGDVPRFILVQNPVEPKKHEDPANEGPGMFTIRGLPEELPDE